MKYQIIFARWDREASFNCDKMHPSFADGGAIVRKFFVRCVAHICGVGEPDYDRHFSEVLLAHDETDAE